MSKHIEEVMGLVDAHARRTYAHAEDADSGRVEIEAKLRELLPGWKSIDSAPRTGEMIMLGCRSKDGGYEISIPGFWQEGCDDSIDDMGCDSGFVDVNFQEFSGGRSFGAEEYRRDPVQPTHWMPLPKAPEA